MSKSPVRCLLVIFSSLVFWVPAAFAQRYTMEFRVYTMSVEDADLVASKVAGEDHSNLELGLDRMTKMNRADLIAGAEFIQDGKADVDRVRAKGTPVGDTLKLFGEDVRRLEVKAATVVDDGRAELHYIFQRTYDPFDGGIRQILWNTSLESPLDRWFVALRSDMGKESTLCLAKVQCEDPKMESPGNCAAVDYEIYEVSEFKMEDFKKMNDTAPEKSYARLKENAKRVVGATLLCGWGGDEETNRYVHSAPFEEPKGNQRLRSKAGHSADMIRNDSMGASMTLWAVCRNAASGMMYFDAEITYSDLGGKESYPEERFRVQQTMAKDSPWQIIIGRENRVLAVRVRPLGDPPASTKTEKCVSIPIGMISLMCSWSDSMKEKRKHMGVNWRQNESMAHAFRDDIENTSFEQLFREHLKLYETTEMTFDPSTCLLTIENDDHALVKIKKYLEEKQLMFRPGSGR